MNQEIKVTKCSECPMWAEEEYEYITCKKGVFERVHFIDYIGGIHHNCPLKGQTITYKIGENE